MAWIVQQTQARAYLTIVVVVTLAVGGMATTRRHASKLTFRVCRSWPCAWRGGGSELVCDLQPSPVLVEALNRLHHTMSLASP